MATPTTNYGYQKGDDGENYDVELLNGNFTAIDEDIKNANVRIDNMGVGSFDLVDQDYNKPLTDVDNRLDYTAVTLQANRIYRIDYRHTTSASQPNAPYALFVRKSVLSDTTSVGTEMDDVCTLWTAPVANSGKTNGATYYYKATVNEQVLVKIIGLRASSVNVNVSVRKLIVTDLGSAIA